MAAIQMARSAKDNKFEIVTNHRIFVFRADNEGTLSHTLTHTDSQTHRHTHTYSPTITHTHTHTHKHTHTENAYDAHVAIIGMQTRKHIEQREQKLPNSMSCGPNSPAITQTKLPQ